MKTSYNGVPVPSHGQVIEYVGGEFQVPDQPIAASGKDGADPVTKPGECKGKSKTPKLIACLQPDRRVDIEVTGTK